jgi:hypothetical protein
MTLLTCSEMLVHSIGKQQSYLLGSKLGHVFLHVVVAIVGSADVNFPIIDYGQLTLNNDKVKPLLLK